MCVVSNFKKQTDTMKKTLLLLLILIACNVYGQTFEELTTSANKAGIERNFNKSIELFNQALELDKGNYFIYNKIAQAYYLSNNIDSSIYYCDLALKINPNDTIALYQRGHCYMDKSDYKKALTEFTMVFEKTNFRSSDASFNIGECNFNLGNIEKAIEFYEKTLNIEPNDKYSFYKLGYSYASLPKPNKNKALKYYTLAIVQDNNYYDPYFNRGLLYGTQFNDLKKAHKDLERSIEIRPKNKLSYLYNGMLYREEGKPGNEESLFKGKEMFNKLIEIYPDYADAYFERAITWYKIGILNMVCKDLDKAESLGYTKATETKKQLCK